MLHDKFFKHFAYSFFVMGMGDYPDTASFKCPDCGASVKFHGDDMNLPIGEEFWECSSCSFRFMISDFDEYEDYYEELDCPDCGGTLNTYYQKGTGQPYKWECEDCGERWIEDYIGNLEKDV